jgi:anti-sigma factor RsiW
MTNCPHIESLLPAYVDGELTPEERGRVDAHVGECEECRQALAFFVGLEETLVARRHARPSDRAAARRVARRLGYRWNFLPDFGLRGAVAGAVVGLAIALFVSWGALRDFMARAATFQIGSDFRAGVTEALRVVTSGLESVSAGSEWMWAAVYAGCLALIFLSGAWMVLRWVRD